MRIPIVIAIAFASAVALSGAAAVGAPARATQGDAMAALEAFGSGGWGVLLHSKVALGAPANGIFGRVAIKPFSATPFDGAHYCALDWHAILLADFEDGPQQAAAAVLANMDYRFTLDGSPLPVTRTAVKRFLRFGASADLFYSQWGRVMAPSDLAPGAHALGVVGSDLAGNVFGTDAITFYVDAAGTGACL
ncbi:MAG: hypothetical protein ACJ768_04595 [Gaiellaceae bacterium]